jgi:hypothetical protein
MSIFLFRFAYQRERVSQVAGWFAFSFLFLYSGLVIIINIITSSRELLLLSHARTDGTRRFFPLFLLLVLEEKRIRAKDTGTGAAGDMYVYYG